MSQGNRQNRQFELTYHQRLLLDMYINFYNHTTRQMDALYDLQSEIRGNINQIIGVSPIHNHSHHSNRNFTENLLKIDAIVIRDGKKMALNHEELVIWICFLWNP